QADGRRALHGLGHPGRVGLPGAAGLSRRRQRAPGGSGGASGARAAASAPCRRARPARAGPADPAATRRARSAGAIPPRQPAVAMAATILVHIALLTYAGAAGAFLAWLLKPKDGLVSVGRALLFAGLLAHLASFGA